MATNIKPVFPSAVVAKTRVVVSTANTNRDGTGTITDVTDAAGTDGIQVDGVQIKATVTTTAGMIRFFKYDGTDWSFLDEVSVTAITPSASVQAFQSYWTPPGGVLRLPSAYKLGAATHNAEAFHLNPDISSLMAL